MMNPLNTRPLSADDLFMLKLVGDAQLSPDGRSIAYVVKGLDRDQNDYVSNIYLWSDGESRQYTAGGKDSAPRWSPDGRRLAFLSGRDGKAQIYLIATDGGEPLALTEEKLGAGAPVWSPDGAEIAFTGRIPTGEEPEETGGQKAVARTRIIERAKYKFDGVGLIEDRRTHICVVTIQTREVRQATDGDFNDSSPAWSPDGRHLTFAANRSPEWDLEATSDIWIVPSQGGRPRRVTDGQGLWMLPVFSPDGSRIAFTGYAKPPDRESTYFPQLWSISRTGDDLRNLLDGVGLEVGSSLSSDWSTAGEEMLIWREDGLYFLVSAHGTSNLYRWNGQACPVTEGRHHVMDFSVAGGVVAYTVSDATHPAEIALQRASQRGTPVSARTVTSHNAEPLAGVQAAPPEHLTFEGAEGAEIDGWLMKPARYQEGQRYPLIVYIHGGPVAAYGETFFHEFQVLAGQGFGLFYCNPHGSSSCGQPFEVSIIGAWGTVDYQDVMAGADLVSALPWVDLHRLGVAGGSYGGYLTNWIISHTDRFAAACAERSICNMVSQGGSSDWASTRGERMKATPEGDPERLWAMSPLKYASQVHTPTLILHSERDDRCPIDQGEQWFAALKRLRVPTHFVRFPEESHGLSRGGKPSRRLERLGFIADWFRMYL